ncbi:hypothetical protein AVCANL279_04735 [Campylobacter canadensis]|uniref:Cas10/Cmr2 second palm domain-containing protein n=3 Tax=Campylobacter canadensis TaxID=449520 RepID=UPI001556DE2C|nr:hypothetical protein [Campylobacter canadensis]MBZ7996633.1 hypothetical protein [Campylobacter canadensis]MBZ8000240.1 hypothetical protein [Campylobacter canadensis]MBZ8003433.1 hypothetical protein [Campylobacter canadensis]
MSEVLVLVDIAAKQEYIFSSNKLKDMVGASEIIARATDVETIKENCKEFDFDTSKIKDGFSGGGNAYLFFDELEIAKEFIKKYSLHLLKTYPSLVPYLLPFKMSGEYQKDIADAKDELDKIRNSFYPLTHSLNIGFERLCPSSNIGVDNEGKISKATDIKRKMVEKSKRFNKYLEGKGYEFSSELDKIYIHNNAFISVVHCDINALGQKVRKLKNKEESKEFSKKIDLIMQEAFAKMIDKLVNHLDNGGFEFKDVKITKDSFKDKKENKYYLPIRPIILNGDDFTFVSEGRLGVWLSKIFIKELENAFEEKNKNFNNELKEIFGGSLYASAGIAICKAKTPFSRAYQLSEELASKAKALAKEDESKSSLAFLILSNQVKSGLNYLENTYTSERTTGKNEFINHKGYFINNKNEKYKGYDFDELLSLIKILNKMARSKMMKIRDLLFYNDERSLTQYIEIYCENDEFNASDLLDGNEIKHKNMLLDAIELSAFYPQKDGQ